MITRRKAQLCGTVQGVGLRPFVARLAGQLGLAGRIRNSSGEVFVEVEGDDLQLDEFARRLVDEAPEPPRVHWTASPSPRPLVGFRIEPSDGGAGGCVPIPPDRAPCAACAAELDSESSRFANYPFTSCVECGPRISILREPPYDRGRTTMDRFPLCAACRAEYDDPSNRRSHAQALACPACGPTLALTDRAGNVQRNGGAALAGALAALRRGQIVGLKGIGGFQLLVDARDERAVLRLRQRKRRPEKPFAVLFADVEAVRPYARVGSIERGALEGPAAPIVLLDAAGCCPLAPSVTPVGRRLGAMLPASPLHLVLARRFAAPLVATSGNLQAEPIALTNDEARARLGSICDVFLTHDRPIARRLDDSVVQVVRGRIQVLRMARGLAPTTLELPVRCAPLIAVGGHEKNAPAAGVDGRVVLWPHVGDLSCALARRALEESLADMMRFLGIEPTAVVTDLHPDYATTLWAEACGLRRLAVQHHHAHVAACMAEHGLEEALGVAWDGFGLGADSGLWGGEFLHVTRAGATRLAHLRAFPLPGAAQAASDTWRSLAGVVAATGLAPQSREPALARLVAIASSPALAPLTSSVGRLFDAVAGLTGLGRWSSFEGQAAVALEDAAVLGAEPYPFVLRGSELDWRPAWSSMVSECSNPERVASRFHATLVEMIVQVAMERRADTVALAGGCFQNRLLTAGACEALESRGVRVVIPERVPSGDGGLALGQAWVAAQRLSRTGGL